MGPAAYIVLVAAAHGRKGPAPAGGRRKDAWWTGGELNPRLLRCERSVIPLNHRPRPTAGLSLLIIVGAAAGSGGRGAALALGRAPPLPGSACPRPPPGRDRKRARPGRRGPRRRGPRAYRPVPSRIRQAARLREPRDPAPLPAPRDPAPLPAPRDPAPLLLRLPDRGLVRRARILSSRARGAGAAGGWGGPAPRRCPRAPGTCRSSPARPSAPGSAPPARARCVLQGAVGRAPAFRRSWGLADPRARRFHSRVPRCSGASAAARPSGVAVGAILGRRARPASPSGGAFSAQAIARPGSSIPARAGPAPPPPPPCRSCRARRARRARPGCGRPRSSRCPAAGGARRGADPSSDARRTRGIRALKGGRGAPSRQTGGPAFPCSQSLPRAPLSSRNGPIGIARRYPRGTARSASRAVILAERPDRHRAPLSSRNGPIGIARLAIRLAAVARADPLLGLFQPRGRRAAPRASGALPPPPPGRIRLGGGSRDVTGPRVLACYRTCCCCCSA